MRGREGEPTAAVVAALLREQFPCWADLSLAPVTPGGWDNRTFRLGEDLLVRLPSAARYVPQVEKEQRWLPVLAPLLPLPIPVPVAHGRPGPGFPWPWSIYRWLPGEPLTPESFADRVDVARDLARFLRALQQVEAKDGPAAGEHNFFRGGPVATYDREVRDALAALAGRVDAAATMAVWKDAIASRWEHPGVWVHGDVAPDNLLARQGRLAAVIDFGSMGVGDPACDLTIAWTLFRGAARGAFREAMAMDDATWARERGWALWKSLILVRDDEAGIRNTHADAHRMLTEVLEDR